jgi:hypothetical protein
MELAARSFNASFIALKPSSVSEYVLPTYFIRYAMIPEKSSKCSKSVLFPSALGWRIK